MLVLLWHKYFSQLTKSASTHVVLNSGVAESLYWTFSVKLAFEPMAGRGDILTFTADSPLSNNGTLTNQQKDLVHTAIAYITLKMPRSRNLKAEHHRAALL